MNAKDFDSGYKASYDNRLARGQRSGFQYHGDNPPPLIMWDQVFEHGITPVGTVTCETPLRAGSTNNALDIILVASSDVADKIVVPSGASITLTMLEAEERDGDYAEAGPSICIVAPATGIAAEADQLLARFAIGNRGPWLKAKLQFTGDIAGGTVDCALSYMPR